MSDSKSASTAGPRARRLAVDPLEAKLGSKARLLLPLLLLGFVALSAWRMWPGRQVEPRRFHGPTMGTTYNVTVPGRPLAPEDAAAIEAAIARELALVDEQMSNYRDDSALARLNAHQGPAPIALPRELVELLARAQAISAETGGAYDVTCGLLVELWGFGRAGQDAPPTAAPTAEAIAAAKARTGTDKLEIDVAGATVRKRAQVQVDLSSIAPGLAADRIAAALIELGHPDAMVEVGGEVRTVGVNQAGAPWKIAIERPSAPGEPRRVYTIVALDGGLATSGDYRQFRELDGVRVSHTIDPRTGRPVTHGLTSVTVIAEDAARADALATALMVMGEAEALEFARAHALPVLLLTRAADGTLREQQTEAFAELRTAG